MAGRATCITATSSNPFWVPVTTPVSNSASISASAAVTVAITFASPVGAVDILYEILDEPRAHY